MISDEEFRAIFWQHKDAIYRFAWRLTASPEAAEDIAQDVFPTFLRGAGASGRGHAELRSFLLGIARNLALKRWRNERRWSSFEEEQFRAEPLDLNGFEAWEAVASALERLPPLQREVLILAAYEGLTLQEMARVTGAELGTVKARLHRARENMKRLLEPLKAKGLRRAEQNGTAER